MCLHLKKVHFFVKNQKVYFSEMQAHSGMAGKSLRIQNSHFLKDLLGEQKLLLLGFEHRTNRKIECEQPLWCPLGYFVSNKDFH